VSTFRLGLAYETAFYFHYRLTDPYPVGPKIHVADPDAGHFRSSPPGAEKKLKDEQILRLPQATGEKIEEPEVGHDDVTNSVVNWIDRKVQPGGRALA
jgi:hypothetical protein